MPLCKQGRLHPQVLGDMVTVNKEAINVTDLFTCVVVHCVTCILIINHGKQVAAFHTSPPPVLFGLILKTASSLRLPKSLGWYRVLPSGNTSIQLGVMLYYLAYLS